MIQNRILAISILAILAVAVLSTGAIHEARAQGGSGGGGGGGTTTLYKADLTIGYGNYGVMKGKSDYREDSTSQRLTVQMTNAPWNTVLTVKINGNIVGTMTTDFSGSGKLDLSAVQQYYGEGTIIPHVQLGDHVDVYNGNIIARSGTYHL